MPAADPPPGASTAPAPAEVAAPADPLRGSPAGAVGPALDGALAAAVLVLAGFLASFAVAAPNTDVWLHLAAGRLVAAGQFPFGTDPFVAADGATWVNHGWLFDLFLFLLYRATSGAALVAAKAGLTVALAAVLLAIRRPGGGGLGPAAVTTLVLLAASPLLFVRSNVASYLLFAVLLLVLRHRFGRGGKWQLPLTVGVLFLIWANTDGGFVLGLVLLAFWVIGAFLQRAVPMGDPADTLDEPPHPPAVLATALAAAVVASLINPYHVRAFRLPDELAPYGLPPELRRDPFFEPLFQSPFGGGYSAQVGAAPAGAFYLLLALGLASFAVNAGGWRWPRVLAWAAFAWLGASYPGLIPYFALVGGPAVVLNVQAFLARRRAAWAEKPNARAEHFRVVLGLAGRVGLLLVLAVLLALAWPGWLGPESRAEPGVRPRRVAWRADPDPSMERVARRLAGWYDAGRLRPGEAHGYHLQPDFNYYCAWFCPQEKGTFDTRLTAPPAAIADALALRRSLFALAGFGTEPPGPPGPLLRRGGYTHVVLTGGGVVRPPPLVTGVGLALFQDPGQWPVWAIDGRGVVCGWHDPERPGPDEYAGLRLDATRRAVGDQAEQLPAAPAEFPRPPQPTAWDRYRTAPAPTPPEAFEAGLWLAYRAGLSVNEERAVRAARFTFLVGRLAPGGLPDLAMQVVNARMPFQVTAPLQAAWQQSPDGRASRAASLLAVRAGRRAVRANPDDPEGYVRLAQAYAEMEDDPVVGPPKQITAARQGLARLAVATASRRSAAQEEWVLRDQLAKLYGRMVIPNTNAQPLDLLLEERRQTIDLAARIGPEGASQAEARQFEAQLANARKEVDKLQEAVGKQRDDYELQAASAKGPPAIRAIIACRHGLAREALTVLQKADRESLDLDAVVLWVNLSLLAGEAEDAHDLLQSDALRPDQFPPERQTLIQVLNVQATAALGDDRAAIGHAGAILAVLPQLASRAAFETVTDLVLADVDPGHPLTRPATYPLWVGKLFPTFQNAQQYGDWLVRQGMLALEQGDVDLAGRRFREAVGPLGRSAPPASRRLAADWLELWPK
ncbi:MAG TPA: hypothetical protein VGF55_22385 [Gemmataceae bacterium]|jgi:hypothetical protein